jgi:multidrug efflux pump
LRSANLLRPKGRSRTASALADPGERPADAREEYEPLIVHLAQRRAGAAVRRRQGHDGVEDRFNSGFFNNKPAVLLIVSRQPDANIIETVDAITAQMPALRAFLPAGVDLARRQRPLARHPRDAARGRAVAADRGDAGHPGRAAVPGQLPRRDHPGRRVPVALVGSFAVMYLWGFSLNNLSLMALIVATGLVVDDAIVVLENISRHVALGKVAV